MIKTSCGRYAFGMFIGVRGCAINMCWPVGYAWHMERIGFSRSCHSHPDKTFGKAFTYSKEHDKQFKMEPLAFMLDQEIEE